MQYFIAFLEGIITFISPCLLPMLPVYISYFAGGEHKDGSSTKTLLNAIGFVLGFTAVFVCMGVFAGTVGLFLHKYKTAVDIVTGLVVVFFGLGFAGVFELGFFKGITHAHIKRSTGFLSAVLFGIIFSVGWTPCVGAFLGSALMLASRQGTVAAGVIMLLLYSIGLGLPFVISAVLIDKLKTTFDFIKKHYGVITKLCGILLIIVGVLMMTGLMGKYLSFLS